MGDDPIGWCGADIAAASLTIMAEREQDADFLKPFAHLGLTVLMLKSSGDAPSAGWPYDFSIFRPLSISVWCTVLLLGIVVSAVPGELMKRGGGV